tara:strand:+ start:1680 stop:2771 length:1092 start_codon:yes stop_codon:yes gene_type:complete
MNIDSYNKKGITEILKKNYLLVFAYPIVILIHLYFLNLYKNNDILNLFIIISLSNQFDIGLLKNTFFYGKKYNYKLLLIIIFGCLLILSFFSFGIVYLFKFNFEIKYIFIVFIGLLANEFKSFFDSKSNYLFGFTVKSTLNFVIIYIFFNLVSYHLTQLLIFSSITFLFFLILYSKLDMEIKNNINSYDFKFFLMNIFSFCSGNVDRFLVIPFIGFPLRDIYLYFTETNAKLYGLFGFFNNLFLYKQLKLSLFIILAISTLLLISIFSIWLIFDIEFSYILFSITLFVSIFSQYYIYSKIGKLKGLSISFFPIIGISIYLAIFFIFHQYLQINLYYLTIFLILKSFSEFVFIYLTTKLKFKNA